MIKKLIFNVFFFLTMSIAELDSRQLQYERTAIVFQMDYLPTYGRRRKQKRHYSYRYNL